MLGKLIRYDGKIQFKFIGSLFMVSLFISLVAALGDCLYEACPDVMLVKMFKTLTLGFSILAVVAMVFADAIYVVMYFRKNIFRDEGYLMHTLPVTETQLFFSKFLTGTLCIYLSGIAAYLSICIGTRRWDYIRMFANMLKESGMQETWTSVFVLLMFLLLIPLTLCQFYAALAIGYTWKINSGNPVNRDLLSILSYIVLYMIQQMMGLAAIAIYFVSHFGVLDGFVAFMEHSSGEQVVSYVSGIVGMAVALSFVFAIILLVVILRRLNHHLDLE